MTDFRYRSAILALTGVLLVFLLSEALLITVQQKHQLTAMVRTEHQSMLDLMSDAFHESLLKSDFVTMRTFIERWGASHEEIIRIRAVAPNGFVVGEYSRPPAPDARTFAISKSLRQDAAVLLNIELIGDYRNVEHAVAKLRNRLLAAATLFTVLLGTVLWFFQRRTALNPLEREIELREQGTRELQLASEALEAKVKERTAELESELAERKRIETESIRREERIHLLLNSTAEGIYGIDTDGNCIFCNPSGLRMLGYERETDIIGRNMHDLIHHKKPDGSRYAVQDCRIHLAFRTGQGSHEETEVFWRSDGSSFPVEYWSYPILDRGTAIGAVVTFIDSTDRKRLEAQLIQSQKMEAIGTLAGGVAHDFNNILTAITGYGSVLQRKMRDDDPLKINVVNILESAQRAARLTRSLLTFGRKRVMAPLPVDLNSVVRRVEKLLLPLIGEDVDLKTDLSDEDLIVMADAGQLEQVIMNLAANARDAMPGGGAFTIRSEQTSFNREQALLRGVPAPGAYAVLSVSDTGTGMTEATRNKIFEPFFTTKEVGKGTGLGLAIAYGIIKQHNGIISVYSEPEQGSTFKIYLPLLAKALDREFVGSTDAPPAGGTETLLVAEDDDAVRSLIMAILEEKGYRVIAASDGEEATRLFSENKDTVRLVILDTVMPKRNGKETFDAIQKVRPDIKVLFMSDYTADIVNRQGLIDQGFDFLQKPIGPAELLFRVRRELDA